MANFNRRTLSEQIIITLKRIYDNGHTTLSGGNISAKDNSDNIFISPAGKDKGTLKTDDIVKVDPEMNITGNFRPSSELPFHLAIYKERQDIKSIIHAHSQALVAFSMTHKMPSMNHFPEIEKICGSIGYASYGTPGSEELGERNVEIFKQGHNAVIMENHGIVIGGRDMNDAYQRFEALEYYAQALIQSNSLGNAVYLSEKDIKKYRSLINNMPNESEEIGGYTTLELDKRRELVSYIDRAYVQKLSHSSLGNFSYELDENNFLVTPYQMPRWDITPANIVKIKNGLREPGKYPDPFFQIQQEILKSSRDYNTLIVSQPIFVMAFAMTHQKINVRTIPESWLLLQDIPLIPFKDFFNKSLINEKLNEGYTTMLIQNLGILVAGNSLAEAYDKMEVAEFTAKSVIMTSSLGQAEAINDNQIQDLRKKFF